MFCITLSNQAISWITQNSISQLMPKTCSYSTVPKKKIKSSKKKYASVNMKNTVLPSYIDRMIPFVSLLENNHEVCINISPIYQHKTTNLLTNKYNNHFSQFRGFRTRRAVSENEKTFNNIKSEKMNFLYNFGISKDKSKTDVSSVMDELITKYKIDPKQTAILRLGYEEGKQKSQDSNKKGQSFIVPLAFAALLTYGLWKLLSVKVTGSLEQLMSKSKSYLMEHPDVTFSDVRGIDEVKEELENIVDFLRDPDKYCSLGGKLPKGILLVGEPGTGKTLLAKAIAGEANVPFFYASGAEFDEMFVGVGSSRIRKLFEDARRNAPCIIFIDEIDACGNKRSNSDIQPYARQTINQLLQEMDGFQEKEGVIVLGATNSGKILDSALTRPGRFDSEINVLLPDLKGRREILELYVDKVIHSNDINIDRIARLTGGMTGAGLANLVNQGAIRAARLNKARMTSDDLEYALEKIKLGPATKGRLHSEEELKNTAFHEAGHALVAYYSPKADRIFKASIRQRGQALGHVSQIPETENSQTKEQLLVKIDVAMGGRVAEELLSGDVGVTGGASSDLATATRIATAMIASLGMGKKGLATHDIEHASEAVKAEIEKEVESLLAASYSRAKDLLLKHKHDHKLVANGLLKYETLSLEEIKLLIETKDINSVEKQRKVERAKTRMVSAAAKSNSPIIEFIHPINEK